MLAWCRRHWILTTLGVLSLTAFGFVRYRMWGPYRSYRVDLAVAAPEPTGAALLVGVAQREITPDLAQYDSWTDTDRNHHFEPKKGDTYVDRNGNGRFDLVWLAGFSANRPAQGINDPLWTRALAMRQGPVTVVMVTLDSIGLTHERFIRLRRAIDHQAAGVTHILFSSTHTHNAPDTMGIWSYHPLFSRFDHGYLDWVLEQTRAAVLEAVARLEPVEATYARTEIEPDGWVNDSRPPRVYDRQLGAVRFVKRGTSDTLATLVSWGNHPEAMGGSNPLISSDYVHYWREGVERGLPEPNGAPGLGGTCLFFQGPLGGLMTPLGVAVPDRTGRAVYSENGTNKARALGENLALRTIRSLTGAEARPMEQPRLAVVAKTVFVPIEGTFKIPILLGLIHPGWFGGKARTELNAVRLGDVEILTVPGELYPEIVDGGVESPAGADYPGSPVEVPPLRTAMRGRLNLVFGLANDEIGYIIPRTQWDTRAPYTYGRDKALYGEINSGGSVVAPALHREALDLLERLHSLTETNRPTVAAGRGRPWGPEP